MSLILSGTDGLSDVDGTAATPAIRGTDANTGIFFPAADTIGFSEGGAEVAKFDSSGNFGLGVTPSAWSWKALQIGSFGGFFATNTGAYASYLGNNAYYNAGWKYIASTAAVHYEMAGGDGAHRWYNAPSGTAGNAITFTQAMTLDASGQLGIGTSSPSAKLHVAGTAIKVDGSSTATINLNGSAYGMVSASADLYVETAGAGNQVIFRKGGTQTAAIDGSGNLLVGTTSSAVANSNSVVVLPAFGQINYQHASGTSSGANYAYFAYNGSGIGSITQNGTTAVAYNTSSDYRLKNTVAPMTGALAKVALLKPCTYKWNTDGSDGEGFIAHELAEVAPQCVTGEKDAVDEDGNPKYQGIDTSFLVATLTAAIQEQQALITTLTARITALESA